VYDLEAACYRMKKIDAQIKAEINRLSAPYRAAPVYKEKKISVIDPLIEGGIQLVRWTLMGIGLAFPCWLIGIPELENFFRSTGA